MPEVGEEVVAKVKEAWISKVIGDAEHSHVLVL